MFLGPFRESDNRRMPQFRSRRYLNFPFQLPCSFHLRSFSSHKMAPITAQDLNPAILKVQYAVRGELAIKSEEYRVQLKDSSNTLPFKKVISTNIGNPQQKGLDQPPITFNRQVRLCCIYFRVHILMARYIGCSTYGNASIG